MNTTGVLKCKPKVISGGEKKTMFLFCLFFILFSELADTVDEHDKNDDNNADFNHQ